MRRKMKDVAHRKRRMVEGAAGACCMLTLPREQMQKPGEKYLPLSLKPERTLYSN